MNLVIYKMELYRNLKSFIIWTLSVAAIMFFGMLFYPAIVGGGFLSEAMVLFENPMMQTMMRLFGADITKMATLMGFYVTYNSIYIVLVGCMFSALLAARVLAREEAEKTAELLYSRPVSRFSIFFSKLAVVFTYISLFSLAFFITSILAFETVKTDAPRQLYMSSRNHQLVVAQIEKHPDRIYKAFDLDDDSFMEYSRHLVKTMIQADRGDLQSQGFDPDVLLRLMEEVFKDPESFFAKAGENPGMLMQQFGIPEAGKAEFQEHIRQQQMEFAAMRESFYQDPQVFLLFFEESPGVALNQFASVPGSMADAIALLELPEDFEERIFAVYSRRVLAILCLYIYLLFLTVAAISLLLSLMVKRGASVTGITLGMILVFYFLDSLAALKDFLPLHLRGIGYLSPFTWMDTDIARHDYGIVPLRILLFLVIILFCSIVAAWRLQKKDILV